MWPRTKFVAKLASARCKPDGMLVVPAAETLAFLHPLPVTALWGVGARTAEPLHRLGVRTIGELAEVPADVLRRAVGAAAAEHLAALAAGQDPRPVRPQDVEKSISSDHTTLVDLTTEAQVAAELLRLSGEVTSRARERGFVARTVGIKIRFADFRTVTRVRTLDVPTDVSGVVHAAALELYRGLDLDQPRIRLVGVKLEGLLPAGEVTEQLPLDDVLDVGRPAAGAEDAERAAERARERFGEAAVRPATLVGSRVRRRPRRGP